MLGKSRITPGSKALTLVGVICCLTLLACTPRQETTLIRFQHRELTPLLPAIRKILPDNIDFESADNQLIIFAGTQELSLYMPALTALDRPPAQYIFEWRSAQGNAQYKHYSTDAVKPPQAIRLSENNAARQLNIHWGRSLEAKTIEVRYLSPGESQLNIELSANNPQQLSQQRLSFIMPHGQWQMLNPTSRGQISTAQEASLEIRLQLVPSADGTQ